MSQRRSRGSKRYGYVATIQNGPLEAFPCTVGKISDMRYKMAGIWREANNEQPPLHPQNSTLNAYINSRPREEKWLLADSLLPPREGEQLAAALKNGTLWACSDGSYAADISRGTAAFQLVDKETNVRWLGTHRTPGLDIFQSAYRSELSGVAAACMAIHLLVRKHGIQRRRGQCRM